MKKLLLLFCLLICFGSVPLLQAQEEEVFRVAEEMPEYPGCEDKDRGSARLRCNRAKLAAYVESNLVYPIEAKAAGVEGTVVVSFVVNKDGSLSDIEVLRDIGGGCGEAAQAVVSKMQTDGIRWNPGRQRGVPVRVLFNLPIVFKLPASAVSQEVAEEEIMEEMIEEDVAVEALPQPTLRRAQPKGSEVPPPPPVEEEVVFIPEDALRVMDVEIEEAPPRVAAGKFEEPKDIPERTSPSPPSEQIFRVVEDMPRFFSTDCEAINNHQEKKTCAQEAMLEFIYSNLKYPSIALENGVEGLCVVQFNVLEDGSLDDLKLVRDLGAGCGQEAMRLVRLSGEDGNRWLPGKQRGKPIKVQFNLPIRFNLPNDPPASGSTVPEPQIEEDQPVFIPEDALSMEEEITLDDLGPRPEVEEDPMNRRPVREEPLAPPPPPPPPRPQVTQDIFRVVEEMPRFLDGDCEALISTSDRKSCAEDKMFEYIYEELEYPEVAKQNSLEGTVVVSFVVEKDGRTADIRILRDIGGGCGDEAARIVRTMNENGPKWTPGKQRGREVRVQYNLPVKFRID